MALESKKGFIYTLEAIIASTLILSVIVAIIPQMENGSMHNSVVQERAYSGLEALDQSGRLEEDPSPEYIREKLDRYIPPSHNFSVEVVSLEGEEGYVEAGEQESLDPVEESQLLLWVYPQSSLNVTLNGTQLVEDRTNAGYLEFESVPGGSLEVTGSGEVEYSHQWTVTKGESSESENVYTTNYLLKKNRPHEVRVRLWQKE